MTHALVSTNALVVASDAPSQLTLDQVIAAWLHAKAGRSQSTHTATDYAALLSAFRRLAQDAGTDLNGDAVPVAALAQGWAAQRQPRRHESDAVRTEPVSGATFNRRLAVLSSFYTFALQRGIVDQNPMALVERRRTQAYRHAVPLPAAAVQQLLQAIDRTTLAGQRDYALLAVGVITMRRAAELAGLRWGDVQLVGYQVTLTWTRTKGGKTMRDTLPIAVGRALRTWITAFYPSASTLTATTPMWVNLSRNGYGQPLTVDGIAHLCERHLGTRKVHTLRHSGARVMEDAGAKVSAIQAKLGHESLATTGRYLAALHAADNTHGEAMARLFGMGDEVPGAHNS